VDKDHLAFVRHAMADVVKSGTAAATGKLDLGPLEMAGKTGTAQSHSGKTAHGAQGAWNLRDHGWFVAFAPYDAPRYAVAVLVEHGGFGGDAAAPKAREVMKTILLKDPEMVARLTQRGESPQAAERMAERAPEPAATGGDPTPQPVDPVGPGQELAPAPALPDQGVPQAPQ
jgi:penicillin-binding protein 2